MLKPVLLLLLLLATTATTTAVMATPLVSERSPLRPGLWWDPQHSGHGFDVHVSGSTVFVLWYTYRADGSPVWYSAQGEFDSDGVLDTAWFRHAWADGAAAAPRAVGRARVHRINHERVQLAWELDGDHGSWPLQPLPVAAVIPELDHSGAWYEPARSGYGLTIAEQGDWRVLAYYAYDASGEPTWLLGTNDGAGDRAAMLSFHGSCPACPYSPPTHVEAGEASWVFAGERQMTLSLTAPGSVLPGEFRPAAQPLVMLSASASQRPADRTLAAFGDEHDLLTHLRQIWLDAAQYLPPPPCAICSPPPPPPPMASAISSTNLVEAGVDEADGVKSDGRFVYTFAAEPNGRRLPELRIAELTGVGLTMHHSVALSELPASLRSIRSLLSMYATDQLLVTLHADEAIFDERLLRLPCPTGVWGLGRFQVELFDRSEPSQPDSIWRAAIEGYLISSRRVGDQLYLFHRSSHGPQNLLRGTDAESRQRNAAILAQAGLDRLTPLIRVNGADPVPLLDPARVHLPPLGPRQLAPEFAVVTRINLLDPDDRESVAVVGGVETAYVSPTAIYLATTRAAPRAGPDDLLWPVDTATEIHRIALGADGMRVDASGAVEGWVGRSPEQAPFRFSEHDGRLRVVTNGVFGADSRHRLHILEPSTITPGLLAVRGQLPSRDRPAPIGKPGEALYATRFVGERLYAVTFGHQLPQAVDPLYVISLADPAAPRIVGEVELPGFARYLHPVADGLLLGIGPDTINVDTPQGPRTVERGLQLALFDVAGDLPRVIDQLRLGQRGTASALMRDHHALSTLALADGRIRLGLPAQLHGERFPGLRDDDSAHANWKESGLFAFDIIGAGSAARITPLEPLITHRAGGTTSGASDAAQGARSLLTPDGLIYVANGWFWEAPWTATTTPRGPM